MTAREEITAALEDYRRVFPEPYSLSPNLKLAVQALAELNAAQLTIARVARIAPHAMHCSWWTWNTAPWRATKPEPACDCWRRILEETS